MTPKTHDGDEMAAKLHLWVELAAVKTELLKRIQIMAQQSDTENLIKANDWLRSCLSLERRHSGLLNEAREVVRRGRETASPADPAESSLREGASAERDEPLESSQEAESLGQIAGGKARGRECRSAFVTREAERGIPLRRMSGQLFRDPSGVLLGIAYGAERATRKNTWFLGLPAGKFQAAVLLCESLSGKILVFRLPQAFVERYANHLSVSKQFNQAKFRLDKRGGRFELSTDVGAVEISEFLDAESLVCETNEYV